MDQAEIARAISAQNGSLNIIIQETAEQKAVIQKLEDENRELRARTLEVEQKLAHKPGGGDGGDHGDAMGEIMAVIDNSDQFKALRAGSVKGAVRINFEMKLLRKAITSTITGGSISQADRSSTIIAPSQQRLRMRDLIPAVPTTHGSTEFVRELTLTSGAGPQWDASSPSPGQEGAQKNASDMALELVNSPVTTIATHFTISRQALDDSDALRQHIETRALYSLALEEDDELLNGDGTAGNLNGLVNNATQFTGGATNQSAPDTIRKAITQLAISGYVASGAVLHPSDTEAMELLKTTTGEYLQIVMYVNGEPQIWRIKIVETTAITAGQFLVGAFDQAATIRDRQLATVEVSLDHESYRTKNLALILIEERVGLEIHRPVALVKGSLATPG